MKNLIVIRTLGDPRPALYKWASQIKTDTALVVASGDDADVDVLGGKLSKMAVRQQANELSQIYGTPIFFLDKPARGVLYSGLRSRLTGEAAFEELEPLRSMRRRSYGVASNEAFIVATLLRAEVVQFVDDDTGPIQGINVVDRHRDIMTARAAVAVTGGYIGAPWLDTSYFPAPAHERMFSSAFMRHIPTRSLFQDAVLPTISPVDEPCDYLLGGNSMMHAELFARLCCPIIPEAIGTDDLFLGNLANHVFPGRVRRSGIPVIHAHMPGRKEPTAVSRYLLNCSRAVAFWAMLDEGWIRVLADLAAHGVTPKELPSINDERAKSAVAEFFAQLRRIETDAEHRLPRAVAQVIGTLAVDASGFTAFEEDVVMTARDGLRDYVKLLAAWPVILGALDAKLQDDLAAIARC